jgi:hypothetical protein
MAVARQSKLAGGTALIKWSGDSTIPGAWMAAAGVVGLIAALLIERQAQVLHTAEAHA